VELRVVLYSEGHAESGGEDSSLPPPGAPLDPGHLGAAHLLVERCLLSKLVGQDVAVRFLSPLRLPDDARIPRGSDLLKRKTVRRLVASFGRGLDPDLVVVLVDTDGDTQRRTLLVRFIDEPPVKHLLRSIVGAAQQAFEAWLLGDPKAADEIAGEAVSATEHPETLSPDEAKQSLATILTLARRRTPDGLSSDLAARRKLATIVRLEDLRRQRSFEEFSKECASEASRLARAAG